MGKSKKKAGSRYFDYTLLFLTALLVGFGLLMIYSTSSYTAQLESGNPAAYFERQLVAVVIGAVIMYLAYRIDYHVWQRYSALIFLFSIVLVLALIPFGKAKNGATRWLRFGPIGIQPADVSKIAVIIFLAALICKCGTNIKSKKNCLILFVITAGIQAALILVVTNNMSSALIVITIAISMFFVAYPGYKIFVFLFGVVVAILSGFYLWIKSVLSGTGEIPGGFRLKRIVVWVDPEKYATTTGFQTVQSLYAIGSGGLFGKGLGKSLQKLGNIPESQNDMIFSIICEELGLVGAVVTIFVFGMLLYRITRIAQNAPDLFGTMLATGVFAHIAVQVILNIAVVTNLIPNTGVSLPFISYGGSSVGILLIEIGIVMNVSSQIKMEV